MAAKRPSKLSERNLFSRLKKKDKDAFIEAYDLYVDDIHRFIFFKVGNKEEANDLTSIVFLKTWEYLKNNSLIDSRTLKALLYKIARTSIVDYYRSRQIVTSIDDEQHKIDVIDESQDATAQVDLNSDLELIQNKLPELKVEYREIIIMRFVNDLTLDEIADITGKHKVNVRVLIFRALKALRELIEADQPPAQAGKSKTTEKPQATGSKPEKVSPKINKTKN
jgi:RNA polymerase sigma-70 factor, ECF subfamily